MAWTQVNPTTLITANVVGVGPGAPNARANGAFVALTSPGVAGQAGVVGVSDSSNSTSAGNGGWFESAQGEGVRGWSKNPNHGGVVGVNTGNGIAIYGQSDATGLYGTSKNWVGVYGESFGGSNQAAGAGVWGEHKGGGIGVLGKGGSGNGGWFESGGGEGVRGTSNNPNHGGVVGVNTAGGVAVYGTSDNSVGVWGTSISNEGVHAETQSPNTAAVAGYQLNPNGTGAGIYAESRGKGPAGFFKGDVFVTGDVFLPGADCAEHFDVAQGVPADPGTVMSIDVDGRLTPCTEAYDKKVAGVLSGAGRYRPAIILDTQESSAGRLPLALVGKVCCKVDADQGSIEIGDLLTSSAMPGYAMKVGDRDRAFGAVIGKALQSMNSGRGLVTILVALQ